MGSGKPYTKQHNEWLKTNIAKYHHWDALIEDFNKDFNEQRTKESIRKHCNDIMGINHKMKLGLDKKPPKPKIVDPTKDMWKKQGRYTIEQYKWLQENCKKMYISELQDAFNKRFNTNKTHIADFVRRQKMDYINDMNIKGRKQNNTVNNPNVVKKRCETFLKKTPVGTERVDAQGYVWVKINSIQGNRYNKQSYHQNWKQKQKYLYEQYHNIKVPKDSIVIFLDGNKNNFDIENLYMVKRSIAIRLNETGYGMGKITKEMIRLFELELKMKEVKNE